MSSLREGFEGIKFAFGGAMVLAAIGGSAYAAVQTIAGNSPTDGWTGKPIVNECIEPGESIGGAFATGLGNVGVGSGPSCFVEDEGGRKLYYRELGA